jgi:hypothetical protein
MFDFEKTMVERTGIDLESFMKSGSCLYLRSGLIERWNTLHKHHTYPNMIKRLTINYCYHHLFLSKNYTCSPTHSVFTPWALAEVQANLETGNREGAIEDGFCYAPPQASSEQSLIWRAWV